MGILLAILMNLGIFIGPVDRDLNLGINDDGNPIEIWDDSQFEKSIIGDLGEV